MKAMSKKDLVVLGEKMYNEGRIEDAKLVYEFLVQTNPKDEHILTTYGFFLAQLGLIKEAR